MFLLIVDETFIKVQDNSAFSIGERVTYLLFLPVCKSTLSHVQEYELSLPRKNRKHGIHRLLPS